MNLRPLRRQLTFSLLPLAAFADHATASVYTGGGLDAGVNQAAQIAGPTQMTLRGAILNLMYKVLGFLALLAVFMIVMGGAYLIVSGGSDEIKEKVKKIVLYVCIGLVIVLFARAIVGFITQGIYFG
jgi:hypothetical protein